MIERFRAIKNNNTLKGRDRIIYDKFKECPHMNPPTLASSTVRSQFQGKCKKTQYEKVTMSLHPK